ncbi:tryptophan-rich sensory protein [Salinibacterium sp. NSLL150]|uniref:tryptophan-rich sensory protein n=1 Tax=unclassified Salinibacterium TaxID=2632331 RepID=UPI0018CD4F4C|nr:MULTISPECIES: tryptophan-rich sensory protein [unclassified Salinibacterium]MBH0098081.1 tryptophan-rich sensory protein [Salinibacterium sp. NSLL35]MBH0100836.1 tryptophan-rich sensory protein [Salinibacterium sp. NSLL150]MBH0103595.1 tryptophan-rich sensory protein [Salinibacterium sp. NSLL16]MBH0106356.1 tryptophan-rich sensory protein [Salinibacterium sp. NSLL17]
MRESKDVVRQITVAASATFALIGAFVGSGAYGGTPVEEVAGGALSADATVIAPAGAAFTIWSVIYFGLVAYAVWQMLPKQTRTELHRRVGYWVAASLVLNAAWILSIQFDMLALSVPVIILLLIVLIRAYLITVKLPAAGAIDTIITDGTIGLYLGWVCVATAANIAAWLTAIGFTGFGISQDVWGVAVVFVAGAVGIALAARGRAHFAPSLSLSWGLAWVAVGRLTGDLISQPTAVAAIVALVAVLASAAVFTTARLRAEQTAQ